MKESPPGAVKEGPGLNRCSEVARRSADCSSRHAGKEVGGQVKEVLGAYYRPSKDEFAELWATCLFVVDANVLLT